MPHRIHTIAKRGWRACMPAGVVLAGALLLAGCDQQRLAAIRPGETTESEIVAQWGTPENVWMTPQGERVLEYNRQPNGEANYMITIGANGRVATFQNVLTRANFAHIEAVHAEPAQPAPEPVREVHDGVEPGQREGPQGQLRRNRRPRLTRPQRPDHPIGECTQRRGHQHD